MSCVAPGKSSTMVSLPPPRKKIRVNEELGNPLPVPIGSSSGLLLSPATWHYYSAVYEDGIITVYDPEHAASLWHNGYFGHGKIDGPDDDYRFQRKKRWKLMKVDGLKGGSWLKGLQKKSTFDVEMKNIPEEDMCTQTDEESADLKRKRDDLSGNEQCYSDNDETCIEEINVLDPEIAGSSKTVLVLNSDQQGTFDDSDPLAHEGYLQLLPEEAMFLSYALGCLVVTHKKQTADKQYHKCSPLKDIFEMTIDQMWSAFVMDDPKFPFKYTVYHHYRSKGWVVKSGLKFGADLILYPVGPPFYHAQFTIMIQCMWSDTLTSDQTSSWREFSWTNISATERISNHVNKTPIICFVLRPRHLTQDKLGRIECLKDLAIQELMLTRWNPKDNEINDVNPH
ncbi:tRNA-splicing endonuclease subunit SEN2-like [Homarus americanus]|uniref:tRNA-splicing endonuclease subunit Sen2 n=1 Tax=Homarus americanus TaxID=6706 RepID=A0A8J5MPB9_HOMAM|nr:tRNA-splicing endonuclease subunit SEN2-like [Homarus americanus]KAG7158467.1 tRNA-splicing endonuclease subunit Sen2-like [Homarus americanus]